MTPKRKIAIKLSNTTKRVFETPQWDKRSKAIAKRVERQQGIAMYRKQKRQKKAL